DLKLTSEEYETLGGFMFAQLDKIPTVGDVVRHQNLTMTVLGTKGRRITKVRVVRHAPEDAGLGDADTSQSGLAVPNLTTSAPPPGLDGVLSAETPPPDEARTAPDDEPGETDLDALGSTSANGANGADHRPAPLDFADITPADSVTPSRLSRPRGSATRRHPHGPPQARRH
ncbi:MAG: transporter associated domain-containing protein, partial [Ktedonobacterales bacterium]